MSMSRTDKAMHSIYFTDSLFVDIDPRLDEKTVLVIQKPKISNDPSKIIPIPFRFLPGKNNKFLSYEAAFEFIAVHCFRVHGHFTRALSRLYIPWCLVYHINQKKFVSMNSFSKDIFSSTFRRVEKTFSKLSVNH